MKTIRFSKSAARDLLRYASVAGQLRKKLEAYAETGAGDVIDLAGMPGKRLRSGSYRILFTETATEILVTRIGPRKNVYD